MALALLTAQEYIVPKLQHVYDINEKRHSLEKPINGDNKVVWIQALSNEWGRLAQCNDAGVESTDTIRFVHFSEVPTDCKLTYASFVYNHHPLKDAKWRVR